MAGKTPISDEMRWQVAAKIASMLPVAYGIIFRDIVGADYDRLEQQVFVALAHEERSSPGPSPSRSELPGTLSQPLIS